MKEVRTHNTLLMKEFEPYSFDSNQKPVDVRIANFRQARISHCISDVIALMMTSMGPKASLLAIRSLFVGCLKLEGYLS